jgi:choline dehydrogenase
MDTEWDYIVVGAGSAGCVVASGLSEDPAVRVLLVEAGGSDRTPIIAMPGALPFAYQNRRIQWGYQSGPEPHLAGKTIDEKSGRVIGGTSSINAMIYNRGNAMDYDGWAAADALPDWDYAHCLPYFKRMETFAGGPDQWRGDSGPMLISRCAAEHKFYDAFLHGVEQAGYPITPDHNGYRQEGAHVAQSFIHAGARWSAARDYLRAASSRPNLEVRKRSLVTRVLIEDGAAAGIEISERGRRQPLRCAREVVLCAGTFNSPKLLMLSGIGPADELRSHGVTVLADRSEVGRNLQNHPGVDVQFTTDRAHSLTAQLGPFGRAKLGADWALRRTGLGTSNFFETGAFLRTRDDLPFPDVQYEFLPLTRQLNSGRLVPIPGFQFWLDLSRPKSRGTVTLRSADPATPPSIVFNHLAEQADVVDLIAAIRLARTLAGQRAWAPYRGVELNPGPDATTDRELEGFLRRSTGTSYHGAGTCRMGADASAVVDPDGRVNAVDKLRVVDASIMPKVVTANLNAPVMMMVEKIADRILERPALAPSTAGYYRAPPQAATEDEPA